MSTNHWRFSRYSTSVMVIAEQTILQAIQAFVSPYFEGQEWREGLPHEGWAILARRSNRPLHPYEQERLSFEEPFVQIYSKEKMIIVEEVLDKLLVQRIIRLLRNLFRLQAPAGTLFVHGGMLEISGCGIAFLGERRAGKTSSLLATLTQTRAAFIDNDNLSFYFQGTAPYGFGWPRSIYVRRDTFTTLHHCFSPQQREVVVCCLDATQQKPYFSPHDFAHVFACSLVPQAALHMLVFPEFLPDGKPTFSLSQLSPDEAITVLKKHMMPVPNEHHQFLRPYFPISAEHTERLRRTIENLVTHVPCYRLRQSFSALIEAAQAVISLSRALFSQQSAMTHREIPHSINVLPTQ